VTALRRITGFLGRTDGSLQRRALRSGVWVGLSSVGVALLTFGRGVILARLLDPEVFGLVAVSLMATRFIEIFTETGFGAALIHRQHGFEEARDTAFTMMLVRGVGLSIVAALVAPGVASFYQQPTLTGVIAISGLSFMLLGFQNINIIALQKELDAKRLTYLEMTKSVLGFVISVGLAYWLRDVWALVYAQVANAAIASILSFVFVPGRLRLRFKLPIAKELYQYGRFMTGLGIVVFLTREMDNALIGRLLGMETLGFYVVAYSLATIPADYLSKFLSRVVFPMFSKLQQDVPALRFEYVRAIKLISTLVVPTSVAVIVLAPEIIQVLYGDRWAAAAAPLRILAVFGCFRALWQLNGYLYNAIGRPAADFYMNLARLVAMTAMLFPLTTAYGLVGAAVAVSLPMVVQFVAGVFLSRHFVGVAVGDTFRPLLVAAGQGTVLASVLLAARMFVAADPRVALVSLAALGAAVCMILNASDIRGLIATHGSR
jgi:O-antigen/teichoic acid export membrane protein